MTHRPTCLRCRRPETVCVCAAVRREDSRTRVVFLQHPREARMPVSTCRLAHLSLPNSEMHVAMRPEALPALAARLGAPGTMVLFPGLGAVDVRDLATPPRALVVVDGTWINARKLLERSPLLAALPRLGFTPPAPSNYRIRREPAPHCLSTIEAVAHVLEVLEDAPGRFVPMLGAFTRMVDLQLTHVDGRRGGPLGGPLHAPVPTAVDRLRALDERLVLLFAEGGGAGDDALLQWVAVRPASGERFESVLRPARSLGVFAPRDIELPIGVVATESLDAAVCRWDAFSRPDDVVATWGTHSLGVLGAQGVLVGQTLDLRRLVTNLLRVPLGGVEALAERAGGTLPSASGRPARRLAALHAVVGALLAGELRARARP